MEGKIPIYEPSLKDYTSSAIDAIKSGWVSNHGKYIQLATDKLKEILRVKHVILTSNGTTSTHCIAIALKYKYPNIKKIYVPNNAYIAAYNGILMEYSLDMLEVMNMSKFTWNIDVSYDYIKSLDTNSAVLIVHNLGNIINVPRLKSIRPDLVFIEDNCEGIFGMYQDQYSGNASLCASISFYGNKTITSGEGGAFITNDDDVYSYIKRVYSQGMSSIRYVHDVLAYNYRMTNVQAGLLYDQLCDINTILNKKQNIFDTYISLLKDNNNVYFQIEEPDTKRANWMFAIKLNNLNISYNDIEKFMNDNGIEIRPFFYDVLAHAHLKNIKIQDNTVAKYLNSCIIMLPSYPDITLDQQKKVTDTINSLYSN